MANHPGAIPFDSVLSVDNKPAVPFDWNPTPEEEARIFKRWQRFTIAERSKDTSSWVWEYGIEIQSQTTRRWICMPCIRQKSNSPQSYDSRGTQNAEHHLWKSHGHWDLSGKRPAPSLAKGGKRMFPSITDIFNLGRDDPKEQSLANNLIKRFDREHFQKLVINWIVDSQQSFQQAENPRLRHIFEYLNPAVRVTDAHISRHTVRRLAIQYFEKHQTRVKGILKEAPGQIHIAFDGARSRNRHTLYGITALFRNVKNEPQKIVLGLPELINRHTGANIAAEVLDVISSFSIEDKLGYFTLDNAGNNDTAMEIIGRNLGFDPIQRRIRCTGHILNLVVKALLFGKDVEAFEESLVKGELLARAAHDEWMKKGPVGKAHNFVVWLHRSDMLTQLLRQLQREYCAASKDPEMQSQSPLDVHLDNDTRWLSQYYMIRRLLKLQPFYDEFIIKAKRLFQEARKGERDAKLPPCLEKKSLLGDNDWAVLRAFENILHDFYVVVQVLQGDTQSRRRSTGVEETFGSMTDVLEAFEFLLGKLEEAKALIHQYPEPEQFGFNINLGWMKLDKYYHTLKDSPVYYAAAALHPAVRWTYFKDIWSQDHPDWIQEAKSLVQTLWDTECNLEVRTTPNEGPVVKKRKTKLSSFDKYREAHRGGQSPRPLSMISSVDEYSRWQSDVSIADGDVTNPVQYWISKQSEYPRLSRMALDVMTVPAMSAECERLFSSVGLMVKGFSGDAPDLVICRITSTLHTAF
ncbi:restless-like transposase [Pochonia chlamydosporia 170]|uniref:Restless-like transposase n=1 Tax=Pochonia chlamydosporia 170 TaxID=1380566 RepID=A0A219AN56_METCM|nr:restless-like transposase [Pochonia chlamydosporia 170]OWT42267.1 restless-like transposase [Pochonia chlamydosporia 170]